MRRLLWCGLILGGCEPSSTGIGIVHKPSAGVEGDAKIAWTPNELAITDCSVGQARSGSVEISSVGDANLHLYVIELLGDNNVFYFERLEDLEFVPGNSDTYPIAVTLVDAVPMDATLRITTDDAEHSEVRIPIHAYPVGYVPPADTGDTGDSGGTTP